MIVLLYVSSKARFIGDEQDHSFRQVSVEPLTLPRISMHDVFAQHNAMHLILKVSLQNCRVARWMQRIQTMAPAHVPDAPCRAVEQTQTPYRAIRFIPHGVSAIMRRKIEYPTGCGAAKLITVLFQRQRPTTPNRNLRARKAAQRSLLLLRSHFICYI